MNDAQNDKERTEQFLNRTITAKRAIAEAIALMATAAAWIVACCI